MVGGVRQSYNFFQISSLYCGGYSFSVETFDFKDKDIVM